MDPIFRKWRDAGLVWLVEHGVGFYPVSDSPYDEAYMAKYAGYADTDMGRAITRSRVELVRKYVAPTASVIDVGIGCGDFLLALGNGNNWGFDINPACVEWLENRAMYANPYLNSFYAATFWDVLEHIPDIDLILDKIEGYVFVSLPIFKDGEHILRSKHFRRDEHCWYFTREGIIGWMGAHGFECIEHCTPESLLGREDVGTFVFRRKA